MGTLFSVALIYVFRINWTSFPVSVFVISFFFGLLFFFIVNAAILSFVGAVKKNIFIVGKGNPLEIFEKKSLDNIKHIENIEQLLHYKDIDEIVICEKISNNSQLNLLIFLLQKLKVKVLFSPAIYAESLSEIIMKGQASKFLSTFMGKKSDYHEFLIRTFDFSCTVFMLILFAPVVVMVSILIKFTSNGPVIYRQTRISKDGKPFTLYKFRTMILDAENKSGPVFAKKYDERITVIGRFLRETRLDEIPQLVNIVLGHMSLVGPRPERPFFIKQHKALRELRLVVKPGLTGLAQIRSHYDLHPKHKMKYDYLYIQRRSLRLNLYIMIKTIPVILSKKGK